MQWNIDGLAELGWRKSQDRRDWETLTKEEKESLIARWQALPESEKETCRQFALGVLDAATRALSV